MKDNSKCLKCLNAHKEIDKFRNISKWCQAEVDGLNVIYDGDKNKCNCYKLAK